MNFSKTGTLADYFVALNEKLEQLLPTRFSLLAHIGGCTVRFFFPNVAFARYAIPDMFVSPDNGTEMVDATFIWWEDKIFPYLPHNFPLIKSFEQLGQNLFKATDAYGYVEIVGDTLRAEDYLHNKYYLLSNPTMRPKWSIANHPFAKAVFLWAQKHVLLMLHAAAVGIDGRGILIVGHGGTGKSTLTCSCLADGFDFVSDDYCLLAATGSRIVYPVYTNVSLNPDSLAKLPMFKPFEILPMQGEKPSFVVGEARIKPSLAVEAIILPQITDWTEPEIKPDKTSKALGQVVYSTTKQLGRFQDTGFVRKLSQRLLGMPVYRFCLTKNLQKNCQYLKKWIQEDLTCTN